MHNSKELFMYSNIISLHKDSEYQKVLCRENSQFVTFIHCRTAPVYAFDYLEG